MKIKLSHKRISLYLIIGNTTQYYTSRNVANLRWAHDFFNTMKYEDKIN